MALFESYERRIDQINAALAKKLKQFVMKKVLMYMISSNQHNQSVLKMLAGLTL